MLNLKRFAELEGRVDSQLRRFANEEEEVTPPRGNAARIAMAAGAAGAGVYVGSRKDQIADGLKKAKVAVEASAGTAKQAGRTAAFRGMRKTADVMQKGSLAVKKASAAVDRASAPVSWKSKAIRQKTASAVSGGLAKGAKKLRKGSMAFFSRKDAEVIVNLASRINALELSQD